MLYMFYYLDSKAYIEQNIHTRGSELLGFKQGFAIEGKYENDNKYEFSS